MKVSKSLKTRSFVLSIVVVDVYLFDLTWFFRCFLLLLLTSQIQANISLQPNQIDLFLFLNFSVELILLVIFCLRYRLFGLIELIENKQKYFFFNEYKCHTIKTGFNYYNISTMSMVFILNFVENTCESINLKLSGLIFYLEMMKITIESFIISVLVFLRSSHETITQKTYTIVLFSLSFLFLFSFC